MCLVLRPWPLELVCLSLSVVYSSGMSFLKSINVFCLQLSRYDTGTIGGIIAMPHWLSVFTTGSADEYGKPALSASESSLIVSILSAGTFFGALAAAPLADFIGRRLGLLATLCVFSFGVVLQTVSTAIPLFVAGRFFAGFGVGLISAISMSAHITVDPNIILLTRSSPALSIRDCSKMDSWCCCWCLPACYHHRLASCCYC